MGLTRIVASYALAHSLTDVPHNVVSVSKQMMINAAGIGLAGSTQQASKIVLSHVRQIGGREVCTVIGSDTRTAPTQAALVNGTAVHVLDFDEHVQRRSNHPSNTILPVVMALGEETSATGSEILNAFVIGCELSTKVGAAGDLDEIRPSMWKHGWHLEGVACTIGGAVAAARLMGLGLEEMEHTIGIAVSLASGVQANYGTSTKSLHSGMAAMNAITASSLASEGFSGSQVALEAPNGFYDCFRRDTDIDADEFESRLGRPYDVEDPGVGLKLYPCASLTHSSIDALLALVREFEIEPGEVDEIHVSIPSTGGKRREFFSRPNTGLEGKFSMAYCLAVALVYGPPQIAHFSDDAVRDPLIAPLLDRISLSQDAVPTRETARSSTVTIRMKDGREHRHRQMHPSGHPSNPLTSDQLEAKFLACASGVISAVEAREILDGLHSVERVDDSGMLFRRLATV